MIAFLIKFSLSLLVFLLFYKLVLEREKMHQINRFLLLFALVFSLMIPLVSVEFVSQNPIIQQTIPSYVIPEIFIGDNPVETPVFFTLENILWGVYGLGFAVFLFRFIRNLTSLLRKIHESEKIKKDGFTLVLIQSEVLPHSFWNYVFVNRKEYENNLIDDELFVHEKAHITQKHSLDILFVEVLQIVFWFHPLVYLYKKAMKLNHEFLADQKVNETFCEVVQYQKLLLQKAVGNLVPIASNLNYSITKKRFIMMTKNQSKLMIISKTCCSLMLFGAMFFTFSVKGQENNIISKGKYFITDEKTGNPKEVTPEEFQKFLEEKGVEIEAFTFKTVESESGELNFIPQIIVKDSLNMKAETSGQTTSYTFKSISQNDKKDKQQEEDFHKETQEALYERFYKEYPEYFDPVTKKPLEDKLKLEFKTDSDGKQSFVFQIKDEGNQGVQEQVYTQVETKPEFEGGMKAFYEYIKKNLKIPEVEQDIKGNVIASFIVEKDGSLSNIKILRDPVGMEKEVTEMLEACPKWKPGTQNGEAVRVEYTVPISVSIKAKK